MCAHDLFSFWSNFPHFFRTPLTLVFIEVLLNSIQFRMPIVKGGSSLLCVGKGKIELSRNEVDDSDQISV